MTIDKNKVFEIKEDGAFKDKLFELMLHQEEHHADEFIMELYFMGWAFLIYTDQCGALTLRYHKENECPRFKCFLSMGGLCSFILNNCLKIPLTTISVIPEEKMARYIKYCQNKQNDTDAQAMCSCPNCEKIIKEGPQYPYCYDKEYNDVYFASLCPECGKLIISKE